MVAWKCRRRRGESGQRGQTEGKGSGHKFPYSPGEAAAAQHSPLQPDVMQRDKARARVLLNADAGKQRKEKGGRCLYNAPSHWVEHCPQRKEWREQAGTDTSLDARSGGEGPGRAPTTEPSCNTPQHDKEMEVSLQLPRGQTQETVGLLRRGSSDDFLSVHLAKQDQIPIFPRELPMSVLTVGGRELQEGEVTQQTPSRKMTVNKHAEVLALDLMDNDPVGSQRRGDLTFGDADGKEHCRKEGESSGSHHISSPGGWNDAEAGMQEEKLSQLTKEDTLTQNIRRDLREKKGAGEGLAEKEGLLFSNDARYMPQDSLRRKILRQYHDNPTEGHAVHVFTRLTPSKASLGRNPRAFPEQGEGEIGGPPIEAWGERRETVHQQLDGDVARGNEAYKEGADHHRGLEKVFHGGDRVWLWSEGLPMGGRGKKLAPRRLGPFKVLTQINPVTFRGEAPTARKVHPVGHRSLLSHFRESPRFRGRDTHPTQDADRREGEEITQKTLDRRVEGEGSQEVPERKEEEEVYSATASPGSRWGEGGLKCLMARQGTPASQNAEATTHTMQGEDRTLELHAPFSHRPKPPHVSSTGNTEGEGDPRWGAGETQTQGALRESEAIFQREEEDDNGRNYTDQPPSTDGEQDFTHTTEEEDLSGFQPSLQTSDQANQASGRGGSLEGGWM
ncbi:uncharacterized protein LOC132591732 [Zootoca vivipara]|uniref:uncharacterized protein LOC132591732 n=1 Tax=Zootoca vivipara TaxID=8524 RepID=UPI00293BB430|nr:uncharacterized protein LOC132591732 [Zootoca vivipara]